MAHQKRSFPLSEVQISDGINECIFSAAELHGAAHTLLGTKASPSLSLSLSFLTLEEYGKVGLLFAMVRVWPHETERWSQFWKDFQRHGVKLQVALNAIELAKRNVLFPAFEDLLRTNARPLGVAAADVQDLKLKQMYTDFDEALGRFVSPRIRNHRGGEDDAEKMLKVLQVVGGFLAKNKSAYPFHPRILVFYRRLHGSAFCEKDRKTLLGALYAEIFSRSPVPRCDVRYPEVSSETAEMLEEIRQLAADLPYRPQPAGISLHDDHYASY